MKDSVRAELMAALRPLVHSGDLTENAPMARYTTLGFGGPADVLCEISSAGQVLEILRAAARLGVPVHLLGNGSNLAVRDGGLPGLTLHFGEGFAEISPPSPLPDGRFAITAQAGASLARLANRAADAALSGLEFASGIPGTVGGAVVMNAGAYGGELKDTVQSVTVATLNGETRRYGPEEMAFGYRFSRLCDPAREPEAVLTATFALIPGNADAIRAAMRDFNTRRREKQPVTLPCCGSTFKRPQGHFAGTLIEQCGLKGMRVGGASVSTLHAGFLVNDGGGSAADYLALMDAVAGEVYRQTGVRLEPEVRVVGEDARAATPDPQK